LSKLRSVGSRLANDWAFGPDQLWARLLIALAVIGIDLAFARSGLNGSAVIAASLNMLAILLIAWLLGLRIGVPMAIVAEALFVFVNVDGLDDVGDMVNSSLAVGSLVGAALIGRLRDSRITLMAELTRRKASEARLRTANEELVLANRLKSEFLARMSHELRTPLTEIIGFAELLVLELDGKLETAQAEDMDQIEQSGRKLLGMIDGILDLSRIDAGQVEAIAESVSLADAAKSILSTLLPLANVKGLEVTVSFDPSADRVLGDPELIRQILANLVSNALKFTDRGSITLGSRRVGANVEVAVTDSGIGVEPGAITYLFDEFRQVDGSTTRRYGGAGVGLAVAKKLVELQGGQIGVESVVGHGSRFWFTLPAGVEPLAAPGRPAVLAAAG
jgi:signal transduction histidine kinase